MDGHMDATSGVLDAGQGRRLYLWDSDSRPTILSNHYQKCCTATIHHYAVGVHTAHRPTEQGLVVDRCNKLFVPPSLRLHKAIQPYLPMRGALFATDSSPGTTAPLVSSIRSSAPLKRGIQLQQLRGPPVSHERRRNGPPTSCVAYTSGVSVIRFAATTRKTVSV